VSDLSFQGSFYQISYSYELRGSAELLDNLINWYS